MKISRTLVAAAALFAAITGGRAEQSPTVVVGSKSFTEAVILGEVAAQLARSAGAEAEHRRALGGTRILWQALLRGDIDLYVDYTGTIAFEILAGENLAGEGIRGLDDIRAALAGRGLRVTAPLGFNNTYAIGVRARTARRLKIKSISDLVDHPSLRFAFSNEFMDRADGWPALRARYGLPQPDVRGLDHDLGHRGLAAGDVDAIDAYTTDADIDYYGLTLLEDDLEHFPEYAALIVYRADLERRAPAAVRALKRLEGAIDDGAMRAMNAAVKLEGESETLVAAGFLRTALGVVTATEEDGRLSRLMHHTADHLTLVLISLSAAIVIAVPLGVIAHRRRRTGQLILGAVGLIQTIPSLALLVFMIPLLGIGGPPAVVALFLYSLLPIVRNTHAGLGDIAPGLRESAEALGLPPAARLRVVELPLAGRAILAGIKTSAVINVGTATLGALIGAGGYGQP
ncbi:MAG: glycine betaine ABC transporter substrate-binding protein, partial [Sphingomonadales bacterium]